MRIYSMLCRGALAVLLAGLLVGCGDSEKPGDETSSTGTTPATSEPESTEPGPLAKALAERAAASAEKIPPEVMAVLQKAAKDLVASKPMSSMKGVGDQAPAFSLPQAGGEKADLASLLKEGPVVLTFYRGKW